MRRDGLLASVEHVHAVESTRPETDAVGGSRPISARIVVVFPQPDSPTIAEPRAGLDGEGNALDGVELSPVRAARTRS